MNEHEQHRVHSIPNNVFVYGTLMADDVLLSLLGRVPPSVPALLRDFTRYAVQGCPYPGIVHERGGLVVGKVGRSFLLPPPPHHPRLAYPLFALLSDAAVQVFADLSDREKAIFDEFEDGAYRKVVVLVEMQDGRQEQDRWQQACVYIYPERAPADGPPLSNHPWDYEGFKDMNLEGYVKMCHLFMSELGAKGYS
mmetsp:Transcript_3335/g.10999  ORF Transcript_3335/g.10999 Transcript_3335/m.10999 type:complete len:195 (+) Transcript_3335:114-698(+)